MMGAWCTECQCNHEIPYCPWDKIGSTEFCPKGAELCYDETYDEEASDVWEYWWLEKPKHQG